MAKSKKRQEATPEYLLEFDGSTTCIKISDRSSLDVLNNFTLEAWVKPKRLSGVQRIVSKPSAYGFGLNGDQIRFTIYGKQDYDMTQAPLSVDTWVHLAVVVDTDNQAYFYVNGVMVQAVPGTQPANKSSASCMIGNQGIGKGEYFAGQIADVRIWNVARQEQIQANRLRRLEGTEPGLVGYWLLNEGSGTIAHDKTSFANHGTITGGATWVQSDLPIAAEESGELSQPATASPNVAPSPSPVSDKQFIPVEESLGLSEPATAPPNVAPSPPETSVASSTPPTSSPESAQPIPPVALQGRQMVLVLDEKHQGISAGRGALNLQGRFTIEAWVYPATAAGKQVIFAEAETLFYLEGGKLKFQTPLAKEAIASGNAIQPQSWYHLAVVRAGSRPGATKLYINGVHNDNQIAIKAVVSSGNTYLGGHPDVPESCFQGKLLEVRVWRYARSLSEIEANWLYPLTGRELGLMRCWSLDEKLGTTLNDKTSNRAVGTFSGDAVWEEVEIPLKLKLDPQEVLVRSTGLEDYGYWFREMAKQQKTEAEPPFRRGRIWV
ncbi:LamG-like jellyroll fold domain-containing protein [Argonema antarcticum]|uniref:LamG-like jellyroll fold domain-containing protein n=1 Tax=Argonema antarcticum TaxID=2942763 RepID=UPI00201290AC|nr:LamG-like jellyroll fold domain-containing protein [Argonema antarcticum]MCL1469839.1 cyanobactin biosynthesis PatC/TenC/TruC family protein [Argonema antarcticum A004/B2]